MATGGDTRICTARSADGHPCLYGETIAVGAQLEDGADTGINGDEADNNSTNSGAVYIFTVSDDLLQHRYIKAPNNGEGDLFGNNLALSDNGESLFVGAPEEDSAATEIGGDQEDDSGGDVGALYVY